MLERGVGSIKKHLKRLVRKGEMAEQAASEVVGRIRPETALEVCRTAPVLRVGLGAGMSSRCQMRGEATRRACTQRKSPVGPACFAAVLSA
jgi:hypothetical protein